MCHLILLLPVLALGLFWIWPLVIALPIYIFILVLSLFFYMYIMKAMKLKVSTGQQGLLHERARVIDSLGTEGHVEVHGEIWKARSAERLQKDEHTEIIAVDGLTLQVQKID